MGIVSLPVFFRSPVWAYQWAALRSAPQKVSGLPVKPMEEARRYRQSLLGFPYAHEGLGNRHTAAASRKQAACQGDTCRMASVPVGGAPPYGTL